MDLALDSEQTLLVEAVAAFVEKEIIPHEAEVDRLGAVPPGLAQDIRAKAIAHGFYAANMPEEVGGGGLDGIERALFERELGVASWALQGLVRRPSRILMACAGDQIATYLEPTTRGERVECFALTEPGAGSDHRAISTRAERHGDDFVIDGAKHFISGADRADYAIVFAVTDVDETQRGRRNRLTAFLIDKGTPGFAVRPGPPCVANRGLNQCDLALDGCRVGPGQVLGALDDGDALINDWLPPGRVWIAAGSIGKARRALDMALDWAAQRKQFGQTIGRFQGVSFQLADAATELRSAELVTLEAAWKVAQGSLTAADAAIAKLLASEMLGRVTDRALQIFGGMGLMKELPIERFWRDARAERIWEGTSEIQRQIIARALLRPRER